MKMISQNLIKTNVMNYGITLLKLFSGNNLNYKGKGKIKNKDRKKNLIKCLRNSEL